MSLHLYLNGGRQSMDGGSKGALGLLRERCKFNGLKIDHNHNYTGGYHLRPDSHWTYSFDGRGQVTGVRKRTVTNVSTGAAFPLGGWDTSYSYDDIGNRTTSRFGGDGQESSPVGSEEVAYEVNALNQYTEIENPRAFFVTGSAPAAATVGITLNGTAANRAVPHFWARQEVAGTGPTWADATLVATSGSSTVTVPKHTYVPPAVETPQYDADGNLVSDGRWLYAWDGENRLKEMTAQSAAVLGGVPDLRLTFAYDGQSRRIRKLVEEKVSGSWVTRTDTRFMYDGWNLMAEVEYLGTAPDAPPGTSVAPRPFLRRTYLWGQDLSGSLQGAGGVGGLLAITRHEHGAVPSKDYWATSDLNGNVIGLITETGLRALYEYDPFGKPLRVSEPEEDLNPFRFSTKYTDPETGLCYYGYRYYDAVRGRWINRDPIEEEGGVNLYGMAGNDAVNEWDFLGLKWDTKKGLEALQLAKDVKKGVKLPSDHVCCKDLGPLSMNGCHTRNCVEFTTVVISCAYRLNGDSRSEDLLRNVHNSSIGDGELIAKYMVDNMDWKPVYYDRDTRVHRHPYSRKAYKEGRGPKRDIYGEDLSWAASQIASRGGYHGITAVGAVTDFLPWAPSSGFLYMQSYRDLAARDFVYGVAYGGFHNFLIASNTVYEGTPGLAAIGATPCATLGFSNWVSTRAYADALGFLLLPPTDGDVPASMVDNLKSLKGQKIPPYEQAPEKKWNAPR